MSKLKYEKRAIENAVINGYVDVIAHQANTQNQMNSGVALALKNEFPSVYEADVQATYDNKVSLGGFSKAYLKPYLGPRSYAVICYNLYGQEFYGYDGQQYTNYQSLKKALIGMADDLLGRGFRGCHIGLPKIGAGRGGGSWSIIEKIIIDTLKDFEVTIYTI